jgi:hypothetical protein
VIPASPGVSVGSGVRRRRACLHGNALGRGCRKTERPLKQRAIGVRLAAGPAVTAGAGGRDACIREPQCVAGPGAQPGTIRGANARLRAPQSAAGEAGIASITLSDARIADSRFAADGALRVETRRQLVEESDPVGRLPLAIAGARGGAGAALFAAEQILAIRACRARVERRAAAGLRALRALRVGRVDRATARTCPAVLGGARAAAHDTRPAAGAIALARPEIGRIGRSLRAGREDQPSQRGSHGHEEGALHSRIEASWRARDTTPGRGCATLRRKLVRSPSQA